MNNIKYYLVIICCSLFFLTACSGLGLDDQKRLDDMYVRSLGNEKSVNAGSCSCPSYNGVEIRIGDNFYFDGTEYGFDCCKEVSVLDINGIQIAEPYIAQGAFVAFNKGSLCSSTNNTGIIFIKGYSQGVLNNRSINLIC